MVACQSQYSSNGGMVPRLIIRSCCIYSGEAVSRYPDTACGYFARTLPARGFGEKRSTLSHQLLQARPTSMPDLICRVCHTLSRSQHPRLTRNNLSGSHLKVVSTWLLFLVIPDCAPITAALNPLLFVVLLTNHTMKNAANGTYSLDYRRPRLCQARQCML